MPRIRFTTGPERGVIRFATAPVLNPLLGGTKVLRQVIRFGTGPNLLVGARFATGPANRTLRFATAPINYDLLQATLSPDGQCLQVQIARALSNGSLTATAYSLRTQTTLEGSPVLGSSPQKWHFPVTGDDVWQVTVAPVDGKPVAYAMLLLNYQSLRYLARLAKRQKQNILFRQHSYLSGMAILLYETGKFQVAAEQLQLLEDLRTC